MANGHIQSCHTAVLWLTPTFWTLASVLSWPEFQNCPILGCAILHLGVGPFSLSPTLTPTPVQLFLPAGACFAPNGKARAGTQSPIGPLSSVQTPSGFPFPQVGPCSVGLEPPRAFLLDPGGIE